MDKTIIEVISVSIAMSALILTLYQIYSSRKHNFLAVLPYIKIGWTASNTDDGIWITNVGLGPAIINNYSMKLNGQPIDNRALAEYFLNLGFKINMVIAEKDATIQVKDRHWLIRSDENIKNGNRQEEFWNHLSGMEFFVEYKSLYQKKCPPILWICPNPVSEFVTPKPKKNKKNKK